MSWVIWRAATPWASSSWAKPRIWRALSARVSTSRAPRMAALIGRSVSRCRANTSRSETRLTTRPASVTGTWRRPLRDISSAASCSVCWAVSVCTGALITRSIGVLSGSWGSTTRPMMSSRVRMPIGTPAASNTSSEPMRRSCIRPSASESGVCGATPSGVLRGKSPSADSWLCSARFDEAGSTGRVRSCSVIGQYSSFA